MKLGVLGAGRMGREIVAQIAAAADCELAGLWIRESRTGTDGALGALAGGKLGSDLDELARRSDVLLDFTLPGPTAAIALAAARHEARLVCGVSGLDTTATDALQAAAGSIAVLYDRNISVGVAVLRELTAIAGAALDTSFACEIHETHHVHKLDAPSGTALKLGEALAASRGRTLQELRRDEHEAARPGDIRFVVRREGDVPGEHTVRFAGRNETLLLHHAVSDRGVFAEGAISAARWLAGRPPGLYSMRDVVRVRAE
ncbi:MAG: 4-hydroxy-tetrahydrodipicolinate reductase [Gammaproteobacteria bacterium]|nr:4-hydroxy-tetrahydrodipicolinate reductase [Gammaproteobacteria bacterium]